MMISIRHGARSMGRTAALGVRRLRDHLPGTAPGVRRGAPPDTRLAGILRPGVEFVRDGAILVHRGWRPSGVTAQFTDDAATYHQRYFARLAFVPLIDRCLDVAGIDRDGVERVLDIGSGSGASVFPLAQLLPHAEVLASDISPQLLRVLAGIVASRDELHGRIEALCFDLHEPVFRPNTFDVAVGCAVLHHLLDPRTALASVAASLRSSGKIVLVEPLEGGSLVLVSMFATVLAKLRERSEEDGELGRFMRAMRLDIQSRLGVPDEKPWTRGLDDKWVFDRPYLMKLAEQLGFPKVEVHPIEKDLSRVYENAFTSLLADAGLSSIPVPDEVRECVRMYDAGIGEGLKRELCPTGVIVFGR